MESKGIFRPTAGRGLAFRTRKREPRADPLPDPGEKYLERPMKSQLDIFANHLKLHGDAKKAAVQTGLTPGSGSGMLQKLRRELGWQSE